MLLVQLSASFQSLPLLPTIKVGPSGADSWVGGMCTCDQLPAKMEVYVDILYLFAQSKEGQQQIQKQKTTTTSRKLNCMDVQQPRS